MSLFDFVRGYVKYRVVIKKADRLFNELRYTVPIRRACIGNDGVFEFSVYFDNRLDAESLIKKYGGEIIEKTPEGLSSLLFRYRKRTGLFIGAAMSLLLIYASTFFVWSIEITGNVTKSESEIKDNLSKVQFREGIFKRSVDTDSVVNRYLILDDDISFIAINFDGTVARVQVKEADRPTLYEKKENVNLVARHDGMIVRVDALSGKSEVNKGDIVTKGQLLVSAFTDKRTGGARLVGARGFVWAITERSYAVYVPFEYYEKEVLNEHLSGISMSLPFFDLGINFPQFRRKKDYSTDRVSLDTDTKMPFRIIAAKITDYRKRTMRRSLEEALNIARNESKRLLYDESKNFAVISFEEKYEIKDDTLCYTCVFEGAENIGETLEFEVS